MGVSHEREGDDGEGKEGNGKGAEVRESRIGRSSVCVRVCVSGCRRALR